MSPTEGSVTNVVADAVLVALRAAVDPVHDAHVPTDADDRPLDDRYAVVWPSPAVRDSEVLTGATTIRTHRWQVTSVGGSRREAMWVAERCASALVGRRLDVPGGCDPVRHESSTAVRRDDDLPGRPLFVATDNYSTTTR